MYGSRPVKHGTARHSMLDFKCPQSLKDYDRSTSTQFYVRIRLDLKKELETIAAREGRSVAQVCEAFLKADSEYYKKKGSGYLKRFLAQPLSGPETLRDE